MVAQTDIAGGFTAGVCDVHGRAGGDVDGGEREALGTGVGEELCGTERLVWIRIAAGVVGQLGDAHPEDIIAVDDAGLEVEILHETHFCGWKARKARKVRGYVECEER